LFESSSELDQTTSIKIIELEHKLRVLSFLSKFKFFR